MSAKPEVSVLTIRPYQLLCMVCSLGEGPRAHRGARIKRILAMIRANPDIPVSLRCRSDELFSYQSPARRDGTPGGAEYHMRRDMEILRRLDLAPGSVLPARVLFHRVLATISTVCGICGSDGAASKAWRGCPKAGSGEYEEGHARGINAIIPPRDERKMARDKEASLDDMYRAAAIRIRPHILLCAVAQYGGGVRPPYKPDNLPEMIQHILRHPDTRLTLVPGADWMMCGPCPQRVAQRNACVTGRHGAGGLYNELKDLNVLHALGLTYGVTMKAKDLYTLILKRIPKAAGVCALDKEMSDSSIWRDACGRDPRPCRGYDKGRMRLMRELAKLKAASGGA